VTRLHEIGARELRLLDRALDGKDLTAPSLEFANPAQEVLPRARELEVAQRCERIHDGNQIVRPELVDQVLQRPAERDRDLGLLVDVVVVQEEREHPDVVTRRLDPRMLGRSNRQRFVAAGGTRAVEPDELKRLDFLRDAVFFDLEVSRLQIGDDGVAAADDADVDAHEAHTRPEGRCRLGLLRLLGLRAHCGREHEHEQHTRRSRHPATIVAIPRSGFQVPGRANPGAASARWWRGRIRRTIARRRR
jgi:hypothetical protein